MPGLGGTICPVYPHKEATYDANGNITHLQRSSNQGSTLMDDLTYHYQNGNNRLDHVRDLVPTGSFMDNGDCYI